MTVKDFVSKVKHDEIHEFSVWKDEWYCCLTAEKTIGFFGDDEIKSFEVDTKGIESFEFVLFLT